MYEKLSQDELKAMLCLALEIRSWCHDFKGILECKEVDTVTSSILGGQDIPFKTFRDLLPACSNDVVTPSIGQFYAYLMDTAQDPGYTDLNKLLDTVKSFVVPYCKRLCQSGIDPCKFDVERMDYSCKSTLNDSIKELTKLINQLRRDIVDAEGETGNDDKKAND